MMLPGNGFFDLNVVMELPASKKGFNTFTASYLNIQG
jgi:hypothetical protein